MNLTYLIFMVLQIGISNSVEGDEFDTLSNLKKISNISEPLKTAIRDEVKFNVTDFDQIKPLVLKHVVDKTPETINKSLANLDQNKVKKKSHVKKRLLKNTFPRTNKTTDPRDISDSQNIDKTNLTLAEMIEADKAAYVSENKDLIKNMNPEKEEEVKTNLEVYLRNNKSLPFSDYTVHAKWHASPFQLSRNENPNPTLKGVIKADKTTNLSGKEEPIKMYESISVNPDQKGKEIMIKGENNKTQTIIVSDQFSKFLEKFNSTKTESKSKKVLKSDEVDDKKKVYINEQTTHSGESLGNQDGFISSSQDKVDKDEILLESKIRKPRQNSDFYSDEEQLLTPQELKETMFMIWDLEKIRKKTTNPEELFEINNLLEEKLKVISGINFSKPSVPSLQNSDHEEERVLSKRNQKKVGESHNPEFGVVNSPFSNLMNDNLEESENQEKLESKTQPEEIRNQRKIPKKFNQLQNHQTDLNSKIFAQIAPKIHLEDNVHMNKALFSSILRQSRNIPKNKKIRIISSKPRVLNKRKRERQLKSNFKVHRTLDKNQNSQLLTLPERSRPIFRNNDSPNILADKGANRKTNSNNESRFSTPNFPSFTKERPAAKTITPKFGSFSKDTEDKVKNLKKIFTFSFDETPIEQIDPNSNFVSSQSPNKANLFQKNDSEGSSSMVMKMPLLIQYSLDEPQYIESTAESFLIRNVQSFSSRKLNVEQENKNTPNKFQKRKRSNSESGSSKFRLSSPVQIISPSENKMMSKFRKRRGKAKPHHISVNTLKAFQGLIQEEGLKNSLKNDEREDFGLHTPGSEFDSGRRDTSPFNPHHYNPDDVIVNTPVETEGTITDITNVHRIRPDSGHPGIGEGSFIPGIIPIDNNNRRIFSSQPGDVFFNLPQIPLRFNPVLPFPIDRIDRNPFLYQGHPVLPHLLHSSFIVPNHRFRPILRNRHFRRSSLASDPSIKSLAQERSDVGLEARGDRSFIYYKSPYDQYNVELE